MILGRCCCSTITAIVIDNHRHYITSTIAAIPSSCRPLARLLRPLPFPSLLLSRTPLRAAASMSSTPSPSPPPPERTAEEEGATKERKREGSPSSDPPHPATADRPAAGPPAIPLPPPPPEVPLPGDCCGSGCVRCVWDIYYDELEEYNKLVAEGRTETKKLD